MAFAGNNYYEILVEPAEQCPNCKKYCLEEETLYWNGKKYVLAPFKLPIFFKNWLDAIFCTNCGIILKER